MTRQSRLRRLGATALMLVAGVALGACGQGQKAKDRPPAMAEIPQTFFYRIEADFILKETGEPIRFDYVVGCGGYVWNYSYTTSSKVSVRHPTYMYQAVAGGGALGMITIDMCDGWKWGNVRNVVDSPWAGKPHIPETVRPTVIWFDDANDLSHGWGYLTDDAYESPLAKVEFVKARITTSSKEDWEAWRDESAANYEQVGMIPGPWGMTREALSTEEAKELDSRGAGKGIAGEACRGAGRTRLQPEVTAEIFRLVPDENAFFWRPDDSDNGYETYEDMANSHRIVDIHGLTPVDYLSEQQTPKLGSLSDKNLALVHPYSSLESEGFQYREVFPLLSISATMGEDIHVPQDAYYRKLLVDEEYKGFLYCFVSQGPLDFLPSTLGAFDPLAYKKPLFLIYGEDGPMMDDAWINKPSEEPPRFITRDGYFYFSEW
tara:strand:- start:75 stop:1373 length:1299 start_codon:yes stop_codon:yes gene_type:complete